MSVVKVFRSFWKSQLVWMAARQSVYSEETVMISAQTVGLYAFKRRLVKSLAALRVSSTLTQQAPSLLALNWRPFVKPLAQPMSSLSQVGSSVVVTSSPSQRIGYSLQTSLYLYQVLVQNLSQPQQQQSRWV
ncbi:hypothetical protein FGO68_gene13605 [Halteria grandinella]|uniref:Uncharacterized protein n=1 Tax=Halteria grandinella TaxID=5974 RepID=A0A8J8NMP4_HALGN|nr:hypothetical protein FGO68_gene13605 [Halteria grandinella]